MKYLILLTALVLFSCKASTYDLDGDNVEIYNFSELPTEVKKLIDKNIDQIVASDSDTYYSTDKDILFTYGRGGRADNWMKEIHSNYHHFFIEGKHYRLKGNKGHPFILHQNSLFFCELNLYKEDYKNRS